MGMNVDLGAVDRRRHKPREGGSDKFGTVNRTHYRPIRARRGPQRREAIDRLGIVGRSIA